MKLWPSISRAGIAMFPFSNDKSYELCVRGRSARGCIYVEINLSLNHIQQIVGSLSTLTESVSSKESTCLNLNINSD